VRWINHFCRGSSTTGRKNVHLTRESEYALLGLQHLAESTSESPVSIAEIAAVRHLPAQFLSKIFQKLARAGLLIGGRGRGRGYRLVRPPSEIRMRDILRAVEGEESMQGCLLWQGYCGDANPCPLHHRLREMHERIRTLMEEITLEDYLRTADHVAVRPPVDALEPGR
jgi:Rrf2 family transcriptional regulator, iron-sulfur cluster assembly transcription factor